MALSVAAVTKGLPREEWLKLRTRGIGGSDASAVVGLNPWKSKVAVFLEKTGQSIPDTTGEAAYWGNALEDVVAREFSLRTGLKVQRSNKLYQHPEHRFMIGNVDRIVTDSQKRKGVLEVKTTTNEKDWDDDRIPDHYAIQLQHYMTVMGLDYGHFAVLLGGFGGFKFKSTYIERDDRISKYLIDMEKQFWHDHVLKQNPPMIDGSAASTDLLSYLYPTSTPNSILQLSSEYEPRVKELREAEAAKKAAEERLEAAKNFIKAAAADAEIIMLNGEKIATWKSHDETRMDTKTFKAEEPEIFAKYAVTKPVRKFLIK
ncbi:YqaJ viral recombinase family protein [Cohnella sp. GCM10012308]|uniref:YqaJ viral recombinase family nuclease n=1 Tax=Cohnella sp. GCM10012308 TaxID=3317329 RepID=UPI00361AFFE5